MKKKAKIKKPLRRRERLALLAAAYFLIYIAEVNWLSFIAYAGIDTFFLLITLLRIGLIIWFIGEIITGYIQQYRHIKGLLVRGGVVAGKTYWWERRSKRLVILVVIFVLSGQLERHPELNPFGWLIVLVNVLVGLWIWLEIVTGCLSLVSKNMRKRRATKIASHQGSENA